MTQIQRVYTIERTIRGRPAAVRMQVRQHKSRPILEALKTFLEANYDLDTPRSPWGKAVAYTRTRWEKLIGFVEDGRPTPIWSRTGSGALSWAGRTTCSPARTPPPDTRH